MASTTLVRNWWYLYRCSHGHSDHTVLGRFGVWAQPECDEALAAFNQAHYATGYGNATNVGSRRSCPTGISGKRCEPSGRNCSLHNYGIAWDVDPWAAGNPHFRKRYGDGWDFDDCKYTEEQVRAVEAIKNTRGEQMFRWLGWSIGDTMHWQVNVPSTEMAVDWATVPGDGTVPPPEEGDEVLKNGDQGWAVVWHQDGLNLWSKDNMPAGTEPLVPDGDFGTATEARVKNFQTAHGIDPTGVIGAITSSMLMAYYSGYYINPPSTEPGEPVDAYTKAEADARFAKKGDQTINLT